MKLKNALLLIFAFLVTFQMSAQQRYIDEVFTDVTVTQGVTYGVNATVLLIGDPNVGEAIPQPLVMNVYEPAGDTETERPTRLFISTPETSCHSRTSVVLAVLWKTKWW
jgi:hypothetical protein